MSPITHEHPIVQLKIWTTKILTQVKNTYKNHYKPIKSYETIHSKWKEIDLSTSLLRLCINVSFFYNFINETEEKKWLFEHPFFVYNSLVRKGVGIHCLFKKKKKKNHINVNLAKFDRKIE